MRIAPGVTEKSTSCHIKPAGFTFDPEPEPEPEPELGPGPLDGAVDAYVLDADIKRIIQSSVPLVL